MRATRETNFQPPTSQAISASSARSRSTSPVRTIRTGSSRKTSTEDGSVSPRCGADRARDEFERPASPRPGTVPAEADLLALLKAQRPELLADLTALGEERLEEHRLLSLALKPVFAINPHLIEHALDKRLLDPIAVVLAKYVAGYCAERAGNPRGPTLPEYLERSKDEIATSVREIVDTRVAASKLAFVAPIYRSFKGPAMVEAEIKKEQNIKVLTDIILKYGSSHIPA